jgi:hypothetical protein
MGTHEKQPLDGTVVRFREKPVEYRDATLVDRKITVRSDRAQECDV